MHCHLNPTDDHVHRKVACVNLDETQLDVVCESIFMFSHVEDLKFTGIKDPLKCLRLILALHMSDISSIFNVR